MKLCGVIYFAMKRYEVLWDQETSTVWLATNAEMTNYGNATSKTPDDAPSIALKMLYLSGGPLN